MENAEAFAAEWLAAWNAHDLDRVLTHYADDVVFLSPYAKARTGSGRVEGVTALKAYWTGGLAAQPGLRFELISVFEGHDSLTILYRNHRGNEVTETFEFGAEGKVVRSTACYRGDPA